MKSLISLFALLILWVPYAHSLTLSEIRTEIRRGIRDDPSDTARRRYSDAILLEYLNEAQREIVNLTWLSERTTEYILIGNTSYYDLPENYLNVTQVYFRRSASDIIELDEMSQKSLFDRFIDWQNEAGSPVIYWVSQATSPSPSNATNMRISYIPIPTNTSTGTITIWFKSQVADLSSDSDIPFDGRRKFIPYHMALAYHSIMRIKLLEGKTDEATSYQAFYTSAIAILKDKYQRMENYTPSIIGGRGRR